MTKITPNKLITISKHIVSALFTGQIVKKTQIHLNKLSIIECHPNSLFNDQCNPNQLRKLART